MRKPTLKSSKKRAWDALSKCVRYAHACLNGGTDAKCVTCHKVLWWKSLDAGHFLPKTRGNALYFDPRNVHPQCTHCNRFNHGALDEYYPYMLNKYGQETIDELKSLKAKEMKWKAVDYLSMETHYQIELTNMRARRASGKMGILEFKPWPD